MSESKQRSRGTGVRYDEPYQPTRPLKDGRITSEQEWMMIAFMLGLGLLMRLIALGKES